MAKNNYNTTPTQTKVAEYLGIIHDFSKLKALRLLLVHY